MADDAGLRNTIRVNQVLSETAFLYGGNAAFVEDLYERYAKEPGSVEPSWRAYFDSLHDPKTVIEAAGCRASVDQDGCARRAARLAVGDRRPVARRGGQDRQGHRGEIAGRRTRRRARGHAGFGACDHDDPRLPHPRPPASHP